MRIDGFKNFKVDTVDDTTSAVEEAQSSAIEDFFTGSEETASSSATAGNTNTANDYLFGLIKNDTISSTGNTDSVESWLETFPPTLAEIVAGNEKALSSLDVIKARYEKAQSDLVTLQQTLENERNSGATVGRIAEINRCLELIKVSLVRCGTELANVAKYEDQNASLHIRELRSMKDLNNDGWIGKAFSAESFFVKYDTEGNAMYYNSEGARISNPMMDPDYEPKITAGDGIEMIPADKAADSADGTTSDLYLKLTEQALENASSNGVYGTAVPFDIPEYIWVERNGDGEGADPYKTKSNKDGTSMCMASWTSDGGIGQKVPSDLSSYMQVQVTGVKVVSEDTGLRASDGTILYHTVVELYSGEAGYGELIGRIRIEGFEPSKAVPASCEVNGKNYVAASTVALSLSGKNRSSPVQIDAFEYKSTGRHVVDDIEKKLGISRPNSDKADKSYDWNLGAFDRNDSLVPTSYEQNGVSYADSFCGDSQAPEAGDADARLENRTGIFISDLRGDIKGTAYNDIIWTTGVNEPNEYAKEHMPAGTKPIRSGEAYYSNRIQAMGGNSIVIAGNGDNYVYDATFVWMDSKGTNVIATPEFTPGKESVNPHCFVHARGGKNYLYNPAEIDSVAMADADSSYELEQENKAFTEDDYFDVDSCIASDYTDTDLVKRSGTRKSAGDYDKLFEASAAAMDEFIEELTKTPEENDVEMLSPEEEGFSSSEYETEMNSFFDTMFGEASEFDDESNS